MQTLFRRMKNLVEGMQDSHLEPKAADPSTEPHILAGWADHINSNIRENVANNPNTPIATLLSMAAKGEHIDDNPVLPVLALENPNYLHDADINNNLHHAAKQNINPKLQKFIYDHPHTSNAIKSSIALNTRNPDVLKSAIKDPNILIKRSVAINKNTPADVLRNLYNDTIATVPNSKYKHHVSNRNTSDLHKYIASNPNTPEDILNNYLGEEDPEFGIVNNKNLSPNLMLKLVNHPEFLDTANVWDLLKNPVLTQDAVLSLLQNKDAHRKMTGSLRMQLSDKLKELRERGI